MADSHIYIRQVPSDMLEIVLEFVIFHGLKISTLVCLLALFVNINSSHNNYKYTKLFVKPLSFDYGIEFSI